MGKKNVRVQCCCSTTLAFSLTVGEVLVRAAQDPATATLLQTANTADPNTNQSSPKQEKAHFEDEARRGDEHDRYR